MKVKTVKTQNGEWMKRVKRMKTVKSVIGTKLRLFDSKDYTRRDKHEGPYRHLYVMIVTYGCDQFNFFWNPVILLDA